ncbi:hypothetical protein ACFZDJ_11495 [Streptomyces sp. NPDC007896]
MSETEIPAGASTVTVAFGLGGAAPVLSAGRVTAWGMSRSPV